MQSVRDSNLEALLNRVREATSGYGERAALARALDIPRQHLNDWLSGHRFPNGEATLRLLTWVTAAESKKQNALGRVTSTSKDLTRSTQHSHEKSQTGPRKR
jgi:hypothetical protein